MGPNFYILLVVLGFFGFVAYAICAHEKRDSDRRRVALVPVIERRQLDRRRRSLVSFLAWIIRSPGSKDSK